jgi:hypothetical protein
MFLESVGVQKLDIVIMLANVGMGAPGVIAELAALDGKKNRE